MDGENVIHSIMDLWSSRAMEPIAGIIFQSDKQFNLKVINATS